VKKEGAVKAEGVKIEGGNRMFFGDGKLVRRSHSSAHRTFDGGGGGDAKGNAASSTTSATKTKAKTATSSTSSASSFLSAMDAAVEAALLQQGRRLAHTRRWSSRFNHHSSPSLLPIITCLAFAIKHSLTHSFFTVSSFVSLTEMWPPMRLDICGDGGKKDRGGGGGGNVETHGQVTHFSNADAAVAVNRGAFAAAKKQQRQRQLQMMRWT
jgi:hypothetical protein